MSKYNSAMALPSSSVGRKSAVLLGLLTLVHGRRDQSEQIADQITRDDHLDSLIEVPADELKSMILSLLQDENGNKVPRPRKPDMRSPLEVQRDRKKGKSKYEAALDKRERTEGKEAEIPALEAFKNSEDYSNMSPFERSVEENRRQREYLLEEYRSEGRIDEEEYWQAEQMALDKKERKRRRKAAKRAKRHGLPPPMQPLEPVYGLPSPELDYSYGEEESHNYQENEELEIPREKWVKEPIQMGEDAQLRPQSWDDFDTKYGKPLSPIEQSQRELEEAKQEYYEGLKREADFKKKHPDEANDEEEPQEPSHTEEIPEEWAHLTPAKRQLKENERHFKELQDRKRALEGDDYKLPVPKKPERQEFKPSTEGEDGAKLKRLDEHDDITETPSVTMPSTEPTQDTEMTEQTPLSSQPQKNNLTPENDENDLPENELNPYERALEENEKHKKSFIEELKQAAEERKQREKEEREAKAQAEKERREWLEQVYKDTGEMPEELAEIYAEEEKKRQEEEAKKRPEPPSAKTMRERVAEESKRRKDAHMEKMRREAEEEKARKQAARDEETARRRLEDPNYEPPPPLTVPKGRPTPPPDYKYPKKAREHGFGPPLDPDEEKEEKEAKEKKEKKEREEKEKKEKKEKEERRKREAKEKERKQREREREQLKKEKELEFSDEDKPTKKRHHPQPETKRSQPNQKPKVDKKKKKKKVKKPATRKESPEKKKPQPEISREPVKPAEAKKSPAKKSKKPKKEEDKPDPSPPKETKKRPPAKKSDDKPHHTAAEPETRQKPQKKKRSEQPKPEREQPQPKKQPPPDQREREEDYSRYPELEAEEQKDQDFTHREHEQYVELPHLDLNEQDHHHLYGLHQQMPQEQPEEPVKSKKEQVEEQLAWPEHEDYSYQQEYLRQFQRQQQQPVEQPEYGDPLRQHLNLEPAKPLPQAGRDAEHYEQHQEPKPQLHYHTERHRSPSSQDRSFYNQKYLQLDKKQGRERGRLTEHEEASSGNSRGQSYHEQYRDTRDRHYDRQYADPYERRHRSWDDDRYNYREPQHRYSSYPYDDYYSHQDYRQRGDYDDWRRDQKPRRLERPTDRYQELPEHHRYQQDRHEREYGPGELPWHSSDRELSHFERNHSEESSLDRFLEDLHQHKPTSGQERDQMEELYHLDKKYEQREEVAYDRERDQHRRYPRDDVYKDSQWERQDKYYSEPSKKQRHMKSHYEEEPYVEKQRIPRYDELDLFKQSYDYADESHELGYREDRRRAPSHSRPSRRRDDDDYYRRDRRGRYADYDLHHYYTDEPVTRERRRRRSYSEDEYYREPTRQYEGKRRRAHDESRHTRKRTKKEAPKATEPVTPTGQPVPQKPAQQFVIPSKPRVESSDEEASSSEEAFRRPKQDKDVVPVMRRHGEPLMVMPEWQPSVEKGEHGHWLDEPQTEHGHIPSSEGSYDYDGDSEKRFLETQATPYRMHHPEPRRHHQYQNELLPDTVTDDLAHAALDTYSQVIKPMHNAQDDDAQDDDIKATEEGKQDEKVEDKAQAQPVDQAEDETVSSEKVLEEVPTVVKLLEDDDNKIKLPKFTLTAEHGVLKAEPPGGDSSSTSSEESFSSISSESGESTVSEYSQMSQVPSIGQDQESVDQESYEQEPDEYEDEGEEYEDDIYYYEDEDDADDVTYNSDEILDEFEKAMEMLRHHSHGFNLETKDQISEPKATPSLRELLAEEEKLIADYDKKIKDKEEKRKATELEPNLLESFPNMDRRYNFEQRDNGPLLNSPDDNRGKKTPGQPAPSKPHSREMKEEMDYLAHQRRLKDRSMRRKRERQQQDHPLPTAHKPLLPHTLPMPPKAMPQKDKIDPITGKPHLGDEGFDMMAYMKRQRLAKEKQMLEKQRDDPNYKGPLSPTAHMPSVVPQKDKKKLHDAEEKKRRRRGADEPAENLKDKTLFDKINREKMLREMKKREADPSYKGPLSPTAHPKNHRDPEDKEDSVFEQMKREREKHEQLLREKDAQRASEDPNYKPKFKLPTPAEQDDLPDASYALKRRLAEERRKHMVDREEQFEDELYGEYGDEEDYGSEGYSYDDEIDDDDYYDDLEEDDRLDYYYDDEGFAHPSKPKKKMGYDRYLDAYNLKPYPRKPRQNESYSSEESDFDSIGSSADDSSYSSDSASSGGSSGYSHYYDPHGRYGKPTTRRRPRHDDFDQRRASPKQAPNRRRRTSRYQNELLNQGSDEKQEELKLAQDGSSSSLAPSNYQFQPTPFHLNLEQATDEVQTATPVEQAVENDVDKEEEEESSAESSAEESEDEMDELLKEVQKELHTRFKNMFEGDMLLPNLNNNPDYEGIVNLEEKPQDVLLSLESTKDYGQEANWLHGRSMWIPISHREKRQKEDAQEEYEDEDEQLDERMNSVFEPDYRHNYLQDPYRGLHYDILQ